MICIFPVEKAIAFGGVATGNMNANDVVIPTGSIKNKGLLPILTD